MSTTEKAYEAVPYDDRPVAETHVDVLYTAARRAGLQAAAPERARVLELGCAHAVNLVPQAFHLREARFVGMDLSPGQIAVAQKRVEALGLANLRVTCADVMDFDVGDERFDYVVAHGLLSWVPDAVRDRVLALCREVLAPTGVAYLSYNAMPAWGIREAVRRALFDLVGDATDEREQLRRARAGLERLAGVQPLEGTAEGALMAQEIEALREKPDVYLLHEYLVPFSRAYWVRDLLNLAREAGLRYVDDVAPTGLPGNVMDETRAKMREGTRDPIAVEQLTDVVTFRQFRATLFCRDDAPRAEAPSASEWVPTMRWAASPGDAHKGDPVLTALRAAWPRDVAFDALAASSKDRDALAEHLARAHQRGDAQARPRELPIAPGVSARPAVTALTRFEARDLGFVTTPRHEYAPLDAFHAALIQHLDGAHTQPELAAAILADVRAGRLKIKGASVAQLEAALPSHIRSALTLLHGIGLLVA